MEGYKAKQLHMQEKKHKWGLLGYQQQKQQQRRANQIGGKEGEEAENEGILVKDWFVTKPGPKKIRAEIIFWVGRFETDISNVDTHLSVPVSAVVFFL